MIVLRLIRHLLWLLDRHTATGTPRRSGPVPPAVLTTFHTRKDDPQ